MRLKLLPGFVYVLFIFGCGAIHSVPSKDLGALGPGATAEFIYSTPHGNVEAYLVRPHGRGPFPLVVLVHGHSFRGLGAERLLPAAQLFSAELCFGSLAISLPGYGGTEVLGGGHETTLEVLLEGISVAKKLPWVDPKRLLLYGFSRGAVFAAVLAGQIDGLSGLVLHSGAYDLNLLYRDTESRWIRGMLNPNGENDPKLFSVLTEVSKWDAPTLILHGSRDTLIPVNQALALRDALHRLGKPHRFVLFPESGHRLPPGEVGAKSVSFIRENIGSACSTGGL
jgi:dipeptidyl aminopeptidase/acylaminoacyl peptidase